MFANLLGQVGKWLLGLLFVLNIRAFPFVWHIRVFRPFFYIWISQAVLRFKTMFMSKSAKTKAYEEWVDSLTPIGKTPFQSSLFRSWASLDECDYNIHLSNSSYAKAMDGARFKLAAQMLIKFLAAKGVIALAGTHFHFIREIPILARYEVRTTLEAWDEKWIYVVFRFVTKGKTRSKNPSAPSKSKKDDSPDMTDSEIPKSSFLRGPVDSSGVSMTSTPLGSSTPVPPTDIDKLTSKLLAKEEPDGATLHTIAISQMCFKIGRITVPPAVVFAANGLCAPPPPVSSELSSATVQAYSRTNPPPHWDSVKAISSTLHGGSIKKLRAFFRGGWKDVPEGERWWEQAMGGVVEERRRRNLAELDLLRKGMEAARSMR